VSTNGCSYQGIRDCLPWDSGYEMRIPRDPLSRLPLLPAVARSLLAPTDGGPRGKGQSPQEIAWLCPLRFALRNVRG
jgi:hypothetical protein